MQTILNIIDHDFNIAESIEAPRIHHQWLPDSTSIESSGFSPDTLRLYENKGHITRERSSQGAAMGVYFNREEGLFEGSADSRRGDWRRALRALRHLRVRATRGGRSWLVSIVDRCAGCRR